MLLYFAFHMIVFFKMWCQYFLEISFCWWRDRVDNSGDHPSYWNTPNVLKLKINVTNWEYLNHHLIDVCFSGSWNCTARERNDFNLSRLQFNKLFYELWKELFLYLNSIARKKKQNKRKSFAESYVEIHGEFRSIP